jgi:hypothetical protein
MFTVNEATWDRALRVLMGLSLLYLGWTGTVDGTLGTVFKYLGFVPVLTGIIGWCPAYAACNIRTNKA